MKKNLIIVLVILMAFITGVFSQTDKRTKSRKDVLNKSSHNFFNNVNSKAKENSWKCLGPSGMPNKASGSNTFGVGQVNRIAFDPEYDGDKNRTVYACSFFGGLWRSENDGDNWQNVNTDFLPSTSVADVCINPFNRNEIFICTGYGDGGIYDGWGPSWAHINPLPTTGIFRSKDFGNTWQDISGDFLEEFKDGGMCREMIINPLNPDQIFVATTNGVYKTENATTKNVKWKNVFTGIDAGKRDIRGIAFKPNDANTIYASGADIFISADGGNNWQPLTGKDLNLDMDNLKDSLKVTRINIAVTPANPERIYAYILGDQKRKKKTVQGAYIAMFENESWEIIETRFSSGVTYFSDTWMAIAVSPVDADAVFYANTRLIGSENIDSIKFGMRSPYCGKGFHADVHDLVFQPNVDNPKLFCGNHGGMSIKTFPNPTTGGWEYKNEGLEVAILWSFDDSESDEEVAIIATQDNGTMIRYDTLGYMWHFIRGGDGYTARIDGNNSQNVFYSAGDKSFYKFDFNTFKSSGEVSKLPTDPRSAKDKIMTTKTFPLKNHPETKNVWVGFTELYSRKKDNPSRKDKAEDVWTRESDLYKSQPSRWKRQITEMAFCKSHPETIYVVTGGQQNSYWSDWHLPSILYKSVSGGLNGVDDEKPKFLPVEYPGQFYDNDTLPIITGIVVAPHNADHIWITYTGIPKDYRVWFSGDGGDTWKNADPNGIFANNPVNAIVYHDIMSERLYLGTDRGLYTKTKFSDWEHITSFPNVRITELKINAAFGKLRIGTFGRGLWEGLLLF